MLTRLIVLATLATAGCGVDAPDPVDPPTTGTAGSCAAAGVGGPAPKELELVVRTPDGAPVEGAMLLASNADCIPGMTDATGKGTVGNIAPNASVRVDGRLAGMSSIAIPAYCLGTELFITELSFPELGLQAAVGLGISLQAEPTAALIAADLTDVPVPAFMDAAIQAVWAQTDSTSKDFVRANYAFYARAGAGSVVKAVLESTNPDPVIPDVVAVSAENGEATVIELTPGGDGSSASFNLLTDGLGFHYYFNQ